MCTCYYLHYHHVSPCARSVEYALHYSYCANSTLELAPPSSTDTGSSTSQQQQQQLQLVQQPCEELTYAPEQQPYQYQDNHSSSRSHNHNSTNSSNDSNNLCATGGCLVSQHCSSGGCRLEDLGGRWTCCQCQRGRNTYCWCVHPMRRVPDTLCYHVVCPGCWADDGE